MKVSLIISTYNRPEALKLCLDSVLMQKQMPCEVIVGDDGSEEDTRLLVEEFAGRSPVPVKHIWHPDEGFRLAAIRNKSVAAAVGDYIVQIDGDIVMHPEFIADHMSVARRGFYAKDSRVRLTPEYTEEACHSGHFDVPCVFSRGIMKDREKAIRLPVAGKWLSHHYKIDSTSGIGCNMAFWRDDFLAVNGYDEYFEGWGAEDIDLCSRLSHSGLHNFKLFRIGLCYHLWHRESTNPLLARSLGRIRENEAQNKTWCDNGVSKYLDNDVNKDNDGRTN